MERLFTVAVKVLAILVFGNCYADESCNTTDGSDGNYDGNEVFLYLNRPPFITLKQEKLFQLGL